MTGKGKTMKIVKRSVAMRVEKAEQREFLVQWNYFVWYYTGGYVSLYICQNLQIVQH